MAVSISCIEYYIYVGLITNYPDDEGPPRAPAAEVNEARASGRFEPTIRPYRGEPDFAEAGANDPLHVRLEVT